MVTIVKSSTVLAASGPTTDVYSPSVQSNFAASAIDFRTLRTTTSMPTGGSISRSGQGMLYDSTGKLTYAPNNLLLNTATLSTQSVTTAAINYILSFKGTGSVALSGAYSGSLAGTGATDRVYLAFTSTAASLTLTVTGTVTEAQLEAVTYQTTPSTYVATTTAAYYGPRFDYDPSTLAAKGLLIEGTRTNTQTYSEQFDNATGWTPSNVTISANATTAPDGTSNADKIVPNTTSITHNINSAVTFSAATIYAFSVYAKASGYNNLAINEGGASAYGVNFNLSTGVVTSGASVISAAMTSVGNGWYRCVMVASTAGSTQIRYYINTTSTTGGDTYAGDGTSGIFLWGAQAEIASFPSSYIPTVASSVARAAETFAITGYSSNLINATYIDEQTGVTSVQPYNAGVAPSPSFSWLTSLRVYTNAYAGSIASPSWLSFSRSGNAMMTDSTGKLTFAPSNLLLNTATLSTQTVTTGIIPSCDVILSFKGTGSVAISGGYSGTLAGTGASTLVSLKFTTTTASLTFTVTGTVTEAQLERVTYETQPSLYVATTGSQYYGPRYDYDSSTVPATPRGLLIEESRSNLLTYSNTLTSAPWVAGGCSFTTPSVTAPNGNATSYLLTEDTTTGPHRLYYTTTFTTGQTTFSFYAKPNGRTFLFFYADTGITSGYLNLLTGIYTVSAGSSLPVTMVSVGNGWSRYSLSWNQTTTVSQNIQLWMTQSTSATQYTGDGVSGVYLFGMQMELGSFATSYIPTTSASVTRAADVAQLTGSALTTLQGSAFSYLVETSLYSTSNSPIVFGVGTAASPIYATGNTSANSYDSASTPTQTGAAFAGSGSFITTMRAGFSTNASGRSLVLNNGTVTSASGALGTARTTVAISGYTNATQMANGYFRSLAVYNTRLPDAILKQKSSPNAPY